MRKLSSILIVMMLCTSIFITGCNTSDKNSKATSSNVTEESGSKDDEFKAQMYFCGSSSLSPIISSIASSFTDKYVTWDKVNSSLPKENISIYVSSGGSGVGVNSALEGTCDFGMLARTIKDTEKEKMKNYKEYIVGADALTVSVNAENPIVNKINNMDKDTIAKIFSGEYKYWNEVDPSLEHEEIVVVIRDLSGGAYEVFQNAIMGDKKISENAIQSPSMGALGQKIAENKYAIGYASFGVYNQHKDKLFAMKVDNVEPTVENILSNKYSIQRPLMLITDGKIPDSEQAFIDYIYSDAGKKAIEDNGYIPQLNCNK